MSGAHITSGITPSSNISMNQPSIFEVIAQESLSSGLFSAFNHLAQVIASSNPRKYGWLMEWSSEIYLLFDSIVQISHLKAYDASFAEKFYGLRRVPCYGEFGSSNLSNTSVLKSFIFITLAPYLKRKLNEKYTEMNRELIDSHGNRDNKIGAIFVMFAVGNIQQHSLSYRLISMNLETYSKPKESGEDINTSKSWTAAKSIARFLGTSLSIGAFFIQFLDYYQSTDGDSSTKSLTVKAPPPLSNSLYSRVKAGRASDLCYLCSERRHNDTVLSSSGFVFCYSCIRAFVIRNKKCPATGYPASLDQLIKLYPPQSN